jgi:hypothetical protein
MSKYLVASGFIAANHLPHAVNLEICRIMALINQPGATHYMYKLYCKLYKTETLHIISSKIFSYTVEKCWFSLVPSPVTLQQ